MNNRIGVITRMTETVDNLKEVVDYGLDTCQLVTWEPELWTQAQAERVRQSIQETAIYVTGLWTGWSGPKVWNFQEGPDTLGIVPEEFRSTRVEELKRGATFAAQCGLPCTMTHLGFIPENPTDPRFAEVVSAVREIAQHAKDLGLEFWFETGQETPVTMLRLIHEVGTGNLGLNMDPANLILYGKANPIDALDVFGQYVKNIHVKDGMYPTDPQELGDEVKVGLGRVRFPDYLKALRDIGFAGELIIEREISGEQQRKDIRDTVEYLRTQLAAL